MRGELDHRPDWFDISDDKYNGECVICNAIEWVQNTRPPNYLLSATDAAEQLRRCIDHFVIQQSYHRGCCHNHQPDLAAALLRIESVD